VSLSSPYGACCSPRPFRRCSDSHIRAFSHTHTVGAGLPDYGNVGVMPVRVDVPTDDLVARHNYRSAFDHATEQMFPGYYAVLLDDHQVDAELVAAGTHAGIHRYTFDAAGGPRTLLVDVCHSVDAGQTCYDATVNTTVVDAAAGVAEVRVKLRHKGDLTGRNDRGIDIWMYLEVRGPGPLTGYGVWQDGAVRAGVAAGVAADSGSLGAYLSYGTGSGSDSNAVLVNAGLSFVSAAHAELNLAAQVAGRSFDEVLANTTELWRATLLNALDADVTRASDLTKLYTALYRTFMSPTQFSEADGSYLGMDNVVHTIDAGHQYYSDLSLWDTYRTQNPWLVLANARVGLDVARSLVLMVQQGTNLPRWPIANVYTACMFGDNANMVLLDTYVKGLTDLNLTAAYPAMRTNALGPAERDGRGNIEAYIEHGFIPLEDNDRGTCNTLAYAYNDWALARVAEILGYDDDADRFFARSKNYANVFDRDELFMCPRYANGTFACPRFIDFPYHPNYVEGNAWHYNWDVPHDLAGMLALWPSPEAFVEKLERNLFESTQQIPLFDNNWLPNPYYWAGNEHNLLFPLLFHVAGRTDRTQYWTRYLLDHRYSDQPDGLPGNDDYGTMSAWFAFAALGFYPLTGESWYFVTSPLVTEVRLANKTSRGRVMELTQTLWSCSPMVLGQATLSVGLGQHLTVTAVNQSAENVYIERLERNGAPFTGAYVEHADLLDAHFVFYMTNVPDTAYNRNNDGAIRWTKRT